VLRGTITSLSIAFDNTKGDAVLDNIGIGIRNGFRTWTSPADNGARRSRLLAIGYTLPMPSPELAPRASTSHSSSCSDPSPVEHSRSVFTAVVGALSFPGDCRDRNDTPRISAARLRRCGTASWLTS